MEILAMAGSQKGERSRKTDQEREVIGNMQSGMLKNA